MNILVMDGQGGQLGGAEVLAGDDQQAEGEQAADQEEGDCPDPVRRRHRGQVGPGDRDHRAGTEAAEGEVPEAADVGRHVAAVAVAQQRGAVEDAGDGTQHDPEPLAVRSR